jgi:hypothetical protein
MTKNTRGAILLEADPPGSKTLANEPLIEVAQRRGNTARKEVVTTNSVLPDGLLPVVARHTSLTGKVFGNSD